MYFPFKKQLCALLAATFLLSTAPARAVDFKDGMFSLAALAASVVAYKAYKYVTKPFDREYWNWTGIKTDAPTLAKKLNKDGNFLFGTATSAHQVEGDCHNNWTRFEERTGLVKSGKACDHWNRIDEDIQHMKNLGVNTYRFSVEWSKIQPEYVDFNEAALDHYEQVCDKLRAAGIKPVITLYHYTCPIWFEDLGGFEKAENIQHFVTFAENVFERLKDKVDLWITFNSPSGDALSGNYRGVYAPGKSEKDGTGSMQLAMEVTKNMLEAHVQTYQALKKVKDSAQIGILHHHYPLKPLRWYHPADNASAYFGNQMNNYSTLEFFRTGNFNVWVPTKVSMKHYNAQAPKSLDFLGLSFYSHGHIEGKEPKHKPEDKTALQHVKTDKPSFVIYPEGMYHSIKEVAKYVGKTPIYVTENGTSDEEGEESPVIVNGTKMTRREFFLRRYLAAIAQAKEDGCDLRGYMHWALMDNFEWNEGYTKKFGLYKVDFDTKDQAGNPTLERTLREGAKYYQSLMHAAREFEPVAQPVVKESKIGGGVGLQPVI